MLDEFGLTRRDVARYTLLPQIFPRLKKLFGSGFSNLPLFIVVVFNTLRIIPKTHPYLRHEYHGKFSIFQAFAAAADHIKFDRKNIDKITIFSVILSGFALLLLQIVLCIMAIFTAPAYAYDGPGLGPRTMAAFFDNQNPTTDIAFRLLNYIFGIPGIFPAAVETTPFHLGLHALFEFYSYGILLVGTFVIIYLTMCVVMETAESGTPFGQRFNKAWAPVRIVLFFGLLLPTGNGINMAQYVLLNAAKLGSNLATNGWLLFDTTVRAPYVATADQLIARPAEPSLTSIASFMAVARACSWAEGRVHGYDVKPYIVNQPGAAGAIPLGGNLPAFADLVAFADGGTLYIRYGVQDPDLYKKEPGAVFPYCGELQLPIMDQGQPGAAYMQQAYIGLLGCLWDGDSYGYGQCARNGASFDRLGRDFTSRYSTILPANPYPDMSFHIGEIQNMIIAGMNTQIAEALTESITRQKAEGSWANDPVLQLGWGGAGIWFNKIAEQNGAVTSAVMMKPSIKMMPYVMEYVKAAKEREDSRIPQAELYTPTLSDGKAVTFETPEQEEIGLILSQTYKNWRFEDRTDISRDFPDAKDQATTGNVIIDVINMFMGTRGLFDMCRNTDIHPLAQLSSMGSALVNHSIASFGLAAGFGIGSGIATILKKQDFSQALGSATSFFVTFGSIGLMLGFILFYVLPFLPFIYFFFAVMTWVKGIFEAMVGMPLWALAHLHIDGEGMPGDAAANGYFYILEIFLRPICIIIGFLGGIIIFSSMVKVLNSIFYLALSNLTGHDTPVGAASTLGCFNPPAAAGAGGGGGGGETGPSQELFTRGAVDQFFYTVVYAIIVYMISLPCFKFVDLIPDTIMRWLGTGIEAFGAKDGDPAQGLMTHVAGGAGLIGEGLQKGLGGVTRIFK